MESTITIHIYIEFRYLARLVFTILVTCRFKIVSFSCYKTRLFEHVGLKAKQNIQLSNCFISELLKSYYV